MKKSNYGKFILMIGVSTFIMYWLMYLNVYEADHVFFSQTRMYMAFIMGSIMAIVMLIFMWKMYENKKWNFGIIGVSVLIFVASLLLVRSQTTVDDTAYMKAMIPHHSIAILTSERAQIKDPRVRKLADGIIKTQKKEIKEMKMLIKDLEEKEDE